MDQGHSQRRLENVRPRHSPSRDPGAGQGASAERTRRAADNVTAVLWISQHHSMGHHRGRHTFRRAHCGVRRCRPGPSLRRRRSSLLLG
ncbi:uncharacterized protein LOC134776149 isoform X3 [Penaeus indicus]|uniref:uncharacterized protein LOC134776149 isoform X3 n=1 Tax=Penaeus indicus TaxID=29960 RepID=UPI00300CF411